jgi:hypothetical protein
VDEASVEVTEAEECLEVLDLSGAGPLGNTLDLGRIHAYIAFGDDNAKVFDRSAVEEALFRFEIKVVFGESAEYFVGERVEVVEGGVEQEYVIEIDYEVSLIDEVAEDVIHEGLKGSGGVAEAKSHDKGFKKAKGALEGGFPFIACANADVVIAPTDVELGKIARSL